MNNTGVPGRSGHCIMYYTYYIILCIILYYVLSDPGGMRHPRGLITTRLTRDEFRIRFGASAKVLGAEHAWALLY